MDEKPKGNEITHLSNEELLEMLSVEDNKLASLPNSKLEEYRESRARYELANGSVHLLYFGSKHTFDPENPQFQEIGEAFNYFLHNRNKSTIVVLIEGYVPKSTGDLNTDIRFTGERGYTTHLARTNGMRVECIEPNRKDEIRHLLETFSPAEIEYYYFLRSVRDYEIKGNIHGEKTFDQYSSEMLTGHKKMFGDVEEFSHFEFSLENMKNIHRSITGKEFDENHRLSVNPRMDFTVVNKVAHACSSYRDFAHVRNIEKYLTAGYSLFIVCGSDHAVIQRPAIEAMLG